MEAGEISSQDECAQLTNIHDGKHVCINAQLSQLHVRQDILASTSQRSHQDQSCTELSSMFDHLASGSSNVICSCGLLWL